MRQVNPVKENSRQGDDDSLRHFYIFQLGDIDDDNLLCLSRTIHFLRRRRPPPLRFYGNQRTSAENL